MKSFWAKRCCGQGRLYRTSALQFTFHRAIDLVLIQPGDGPGNLVALGAEERLDENIGSVSVELNTDDLCEIDNTVSKITVQGTRYPEKLEKITGL